MAAAPQRLHGDRGGSRRWRRPMPPMRRSRRATIAARCTACRWRTRTCITTPARSSPAARRSAAISSPTTTSTALQRLKDAGTVRLGSLQMVEFAYGPTGHNPHYGAVHNPWNVDHITGGSSSGSGSAVAARLTFAALGSDTGGSIRMPAHFCGVTGLKTTVGRDQPRRRDAAVAIARHRRAAGAHGRGLRAAAGPDGGRRSRRSHRDRRCRCRITWPRRTGSIKGLKIGVPTAFYVDDLDAEVARILDETIATLKTRGRRDRQGRTAGPAPAHRRLPVRARGRSRRLPQAMDDRAAAGLRPAGPDAAAERACDSRRVLSRGDALARSGAGGVSRGGRRHRCRARAGGAGAGADHRRERCRQQPRRGSGDPAADALHPAGQLSRPAVAVDSGGLHRQRACRSACS